MPKVYIDGVEYEARDGLNMLDVVLENGLDLPHFCWHPAMGSVGACRMCAVKAFKDETDTTGRIQMACMMPAAEGTRISLKDSAAAEFRRYVIEWLMLNHPHDCPVCDEGGECHLQDMTAMSGHVYRRYRGKKRTYRNQYLGPFINHEMNRCIQCYRCMRFYRDLAGGRDFNVFGSRNRIYFGRHEDGVLESEFSGNLVEVCPTGVFTDLTFKNHYTRKWDLETAPSVCVHCGLGCNTIPGARYGMLRRIRSRFNHEVNGYFLCDRGRFGYEFVNGDKRVTKCLTRTSGEESVLEWAEAVKSVKAAIANAKGVVGIGSPRASLESNHALRSLVGTDNFSNGFSSWEHRASAAALNELRDCGSSVVSLGDTQKADVVLVLGIDPTNESPMLDFSIRQAMRNAPIDIARKLRIHDWDANAVATALQGAKGKLYTASAWPIKLEEIAAGAFHGSPDSIADFAGSVLDCLRSDIDAEAAPAESSSSDQQTAANPADVAAALRGARNPLVVTGISAGAEIIRAAAELTKQLTGDQRPCGLFIAAPEANTLGVAIMGGVSVDESLRRIASGEADTLIVMENDLARRTGAASLDKALGAAANIIAIDCICHSTTDAAHTVLPAASWAESTGTFVNNEARAQRFFQVFVPENDLRPAWRILADAADRGEWSSVFDVLCDLTQKQPWFEPALQAAPAPDWTAPADRKVARLSHRSSGRTAKDADKSIREPQPPDDPDSPLAFTMEGEQNPTPAPLVARFWWPGWNSPSAINKFQDEIGGVLHGGCSGVRIVELGSISLAAENAPDAHSSASMWVVPRPCIFGSEELSAYAPGIAELTPSAVVSLHPAAAERMGLHEGASAAFTVDGKRFTLPVELDESMPENVAGVPANLAETVGIPAPIKCDLEKGE